MRYLVNVETFSVFLYTGNVAISLIPMQTVEYDMYVVENLKDPKYNLHIINNYIKKNILSLMSTISEGTVVESGYVEPPGYFGE
jgi:hypothetical protein